MALLRATCTFHGPDGVTINEGGLFYDSDPIVKGREQLFESADAAAAAEVVQTATARPGSRSNARRLNTAAKKTAKKTAPAADDKTADSGGE